MIRKSSNLEIIYCKALFFGCYKMLNELLYQYCTILL